MKKLMMVVCAVAAGAVFADKVTLKSGTVITGKILGTEGGVIKFESDDFGKLDVKPDSVAQVFDASAKPVAVAEIAPVPKEPEVWHGSVNIGFQSDRGNTYGDSASVIANLNRRFDEDRLNFDFGYQYAKSGTSKDDSVKSKDRIEAEGKWDHFWTKRYYNDLDVRYERDMLQGLEYRIRAGLGLVGWQWLEKERFDATGVWSFKQELGIAYIAQKFEDETEAKENFAALTYSHDLDWVPKWAEGIDVFHHFEFLPEVDDFENYLAKANVGLSTMIMWNIDLLAKIEWEFNSQPSGDRKKYDTRYIVGFGYKW